jgi:hypothetical protein
VKIVGQIQIRSEWKRSEGKSEDDWTDTDKEWMETE